MNLKNRKGKTIIDRKLLFEQSEEVLRLLFSNFFPVHIEPNFLTDTMTYYGLSNLFDEIIEGEVIPTYEIIITWERDKGPSMQFKKL